ncbi:MAG: hypothetical protein E6767_20300 [Dysgonomonas sp.]|nr:hypothetical protein [Dysgonomonas sp.]
MAKLSDDQIRWILSLDAKGVQSELDGLSSKSVQFTNDNKKLVAELKNVEKWMKEAEKDMLKLSNAGDTTSVSYQNARNAFNQLGQSAATLRQQIVSNNKAIRENDDRANQIIRTMRVEEMTMEQLTKRAKELEIQLNKTSAAADPKVYSQLNKELEALKKRMDELKNGTEETSSTLSGTMTKAIVAVTAAIALAKQGFKLFEDVMMSNRATGTEFKGMMDGLNNAMDYFKVALAHLDFTNFINGLKEAYGVGREVSIMLEDLYDRMNAFRLTSAKEIAEIEELKVELRNVNLSEKERLKIGNEIIARTQKLAEEEKKIRKDNVEATEKILMNQTELTAEEIKYMAFKRNSNAEDIENIKKIKALEGDLIHLRKNAKTWDEYSNGGKNNYYVEQLKETNAEIKQYESLISKLKVDYKLTDPKEYEIASNAIEKWGKTTKEAIDNYVDANLQLINVDTRTTRSLKMVQRTIDGLTKKQNGTATPEQRQRTALNELNKELEIKYQKELAGIKKQYRDGEIKSEAEYNRKIFAADQANYLLRKTSLEEFLKAPLNKKIRSDIEKELATLESKRLDKEIKYQAELEKIILNADPEEKEKKQYENRLRELGIFGKSREHLQLELIDAETEQEKELIEKKIKAREVLEKQHQDNMFAIRQQAKNREKAQSEEDFENSFKDRKNELQLELNDLTVQVQMLKGNSFEAEMAVHMKRLQMLQEEVVARKKAGLDTSKQLENIGRVETQLTATIQKETAKRSATYNQYSNMLGTAMGEFLSGQKSALEAFGDAMLDILFDVLTQIINQKIIEATAVAIAEQAKAAAIASAMPDSVASFGVSGAIRTAAIGAIIMGALQAAKTTLKGMIGKRSSSDSSSTGGTGQREYSGGYADGGYHEGYTGAGSKYEVKGYFPDGQPYHAGEYIIPKEVLHRPDVAPVVRHLESIRQQHSNQNPLPKGFAEGGYHSNDQVDTGNAIQMTQMMYPVLVKLTTVMEEVRDKDFDINYSKWEKAHNTMQRARQGAKKR